MELMFSKASRIFLQTHIWPMLLRESRIREIRLQIVDGAGKQVPVFVNSQKTTIDTLECFSWVFFVSIERSRFEEELLAGKQRAETLQHELQRTKTLLERTGSMAGVGGWELDLVANTIFWSDETCRIHGVQPGYSPQLSEAIQFYAPQARPVIEAAVGQAIATGQRWDLELPFIQKDGTEIWVRALGMAQYEQEKPVRLVGAFQDITERRLADAALMISESQFRGAFETAAQGVALVSLQGGFIKVNESLCVMLGYSNAELLATDFQTITHPEDLNADLSLMHQLLAGEITNYQMEKRYFHKDGHIVWILLAVSQVRDADGGPLHFVSQIQDISERKHAVAHLELAMSVARLGILHWQLADGCIVLDPSHAAPLGYKVQEAIPPCQLEQFVHPGDLPALITMRDAYLAGGLPIDVEIRVRARDDSFSWVRLLAQREDPRSSMLLGIYDDITPRKVAQATANSAQQRMITLVASLPDVVLTCDVGGLLTDLHVPAAISGHLISGQWSGRHYSDVLPKTLSEVLDTAIVAAWEDPEPQRGRAAIVVRGKTIHFGISVTRLADQRQWPSGFLVVLRDETEVRMAEQQLTHMAFHDALTGLPNRRLFEDRLHQAREKSARNTSYCALVMIDLDKFKALNDTHGHEAGDLLLQQVAERLRGVLRGSDTVARLGGDEFIILLDDLGTVGPDAEAHVAAVLAKLHSALHTDFVLGEITHAGAASIGHALFCGMNPENEAVFSDADAAMYAAKAARRAAAAP